MAFSYHHRAALGVKKATLIAETRIIKSKESKWLEKARAARNKQAALASDQSLWTYHHLRTHRLHVVRPEARATNLAFGFLKGTPYKAIEAKVHNQTYYDLVMPGMGYQKSPYQTFWEKVLGIVNRFSHGTYIMAEIEAWRDKA